ncbi:MAG: hypothetical protein MJ250_05745 [Alphaproteobacteria bacterium]|nr:hypothetical protein [Alphaproteobacteria bacterium]
MNKFIFCLCCLISLGCQARDVRLTSNAQTELLEDGKMVGKMPLIVSVKKQANYEIVVNGKKYHLDLTLQQGRSGGLTSTTTEESTCAPIMDGISTSVKSSSRGTTTSSESTIDEDDEKKDDETEVVALQYTPTDYYINVSTQKEDLKVKKFILTHYGDLKFGNERSLMTLSAMTKLPEQTLSEKLNHTVSADEAATLIGK